MLESFQEMERQFPASWPVRAVVPPAVRTYSICTVLPVMLASPDFQIQPGGGLIGTTENPLADVCVMAPSVPPTDQIPVLLGGQT